MSVEVVKEMSKSFFPYAQQRLGFDKPCDIQYLDDPENAEDPLGKTAYYDPNSMTVSLYVVGRHPKDILRSLSHELVHHAQNCRGESAGGMIASEGYAQEDEHLREMEREAYEQGNLIFRDWEDSYKATRNEQKENIMEHFDKRRVKLNQEIMKKFGFTPKEPKKEAPKEEPKKTKKENE